MKTIVIETVAYFLLTLVFTSWHLGYRLGPSLIKHLFKRIFGRGAKARIVNNPAIGKFLQKLNYKHFTVVESPVAFGVAFPTNTVVVSSKIYETQNLNLIKYVLAHEVAHLRLNQRKKWVVFYFLCLVLFLLICLTFPLSIFSILLLAFVTGQIILRISRFFEDEADLASAKILGKENVALAIKNLFILNKKSFRRRSWFRHFYLVNRDFPDRLKAIGVKYK